MLHNIFDSHAHYDDPRFDDDREALLAELFAGGVDAIMNIGADLETSRRGAALAGAHQNIYSAVGAHPYSADSLPADYLEQFEALVKLPRVRAIGEIGLDYHGEVPEPALQRQVFRAQIALAKRLKLPVIVHDRDAHGDVMEILEETRPAGVVHCYSGSAEMAKRLLELGFYIGFTGVITFKNARKAVEAAGAVPMDRLLIETDCPYLAPEPYRGQRCHSGMLAEIATKLAEIKGIAPQALIDQTNQNARRVFGI